MIPDNDNYEDRMEDGFATDFEMAAEPSRTYAASLEKMRFVGKADGTAAIKQAILKMINTQRYQYEIYSWDYGIELLDLFGKPMPYVMSEVKQRITDALMTDDRIEQIRDFTVERVGKNGLHCAFAVTTVQGEEIRMEKEVKV